MVPIHSGYRICSVTCYDTPVWFLCVYLFRHRNSFLLPLVHALRAEECAGMVYDDLVGNILQQRGSDPVRIAEVVVEVLHDAAVEHEIRNGRRADRTLFDVAQRRIVCESDFNQIGNGGIGTIAWYDLDGQDYVAEIGFRLQDPGQRIRLDGVVHQQLHDAGWLVVFDADIAVRMEQLA